MATIRATIFASVHAPLIHPVVAAKMMVTADHACRGRFGLNIVCGHDEGEFAMFGVPCLEGAERYRHGEEWLTIVTRLWTEGDDFDSEGAHFTLRGVRSKPKPYGGTRPVILNAARSEAGQSFAARHADAFFTSARASTYDVATGTITPDFRELVRHLSEARARAAALGRQIAIYTNVKITCRPTVAEAVDYHRYAIEEHADWAAVDAQIVASGGTADLTSPAYLERRHNVLREFPLIGDPDRVAELLATLAEAGFDGIALTFVNCLAELPYFAQEVLPRLERSQLRMPLGAVAKS
jgi:alkanesulfonate monooxygenase SsuD/methylene tetrahydromethanopterin reductase-like flavin-dependent oxidoreductase (luciferase family)